MLVTVGLLSACHKDSGPPPQPAPQPRVSSAPVIAKKGPSAADLTAGMVEAASQGKSQLPVELKFDLKQRPALGQALDIDIAVVGPNQIDFPAVEAGQVYRQSVTVTPTADGVLLLGLTVSLKHDETTESRAFSIPLIVER